MTQFDTDWEWQKNIQSLAIRQFYSDRIEAWRGCAIVELDQEGDRLSQMLDFGGVDKMLRHPDGRLSFLAQRFRRPAYQAFNDITLRKSRPSGHPTEWGKLITALERSEFMAEYYVYGQVNEAETGFARFRVLRLKGLVHAILEGKIATTVRENKDGSSTFYVVSFPLIPREFIFFDYSEGKQLRLPETLLEGPDV